MIRFIIDVSDTVCRSAEPRRFRAKNRPFFACFEMGKVACRKNASLLMHFNLVGQLCSKITDFKNEVAGSKVAPNSVLR
jgi:hypothetical protein